MANLTMGRKLRSQAIDWWNHGDPRAGSPKKWPESRKSLCGHTRQCRRRGRLQAVAIWVPSVWQATNLLVGRVASDGESLDFRQGSGVGGRKKKEEEESGKRWSMSNRSEGK